MATYEELNNRIHTIADEVNGRKITQEALDDLIENARQIDHVGAQVHFMAAKGLLCFYQGETKKAFDLLFDAFSLAGQINDDEALIRAQYNLGTVYGLLGLYEHSFQYLMLALENAQKNNFEAYFGGIYNNIGVCLFKQDMIEEAGKYCQLAYDYFLEKGTVQNHVYTSLNMAVYKMRMNLFEEAQAYLETAEQFVDQLPTILLWGIKVNYARLHAYSGEYDKSLEEMNRIYDEFFSENVETALYDHVLEWCNIFMAHDRLQMTKEFIERILVNLKISGSSTAAELMLMLANLYDEDGRFQDASELFRKSVNMKSEIYKQNQQFITQNTLRLIEMTKKNQELVNTSRRDAVTGCLNRLSLSLEGKQLVDKINAQNGTLAVIMFDIDYFKQYNDHYGHLKGDRCIISMVDTIRKVYPEEEKYLYRYGGDEFLILWPLHRYSGKEIAMKMLEAIRGLKLPHEWSPVSDIATASIGVSTLPENNGDLRSGIDAADLNLYKAKFNGRNCASIDEEYLIK